MFIKTTTQRNYPDAPLTSDDIATMDGLTVSVPAELCLESPEVQQHVASVGRALDDLSQAIGRRLQLRLRHGAEPAVDVATTSH